MEAKSVDEIPIARTGSMEPKWDGFRCLVFRDGPGRSCKSVRPPFTRYFRRSSRPPRRLPARRFCSTARSRAGRTRLLVRRALAAHHPAASRIARLAGETPALMIVFDLLVDVNGKALTICRCASGRPRLARFRSSIRESRAFRLSPATVRLAEAKGWLKKVGARSTHHRETARPPLRGRQPPTASRRSRITAAPNCVVGGFRYNEGKRSWLAAARAP